MRCVLLDSKDSEIYSRLDYYQKSVHLWMIPYNRPNKTVEFISIPPSCIDVCFIIGHNTDIDNYLKTHSPHENIIVLITCYSDYKFASKYLPEKTVFISHQTDGHSNLYDGKSFGFDFNITESELKFYNKHNIKDFVCRLDSAFTKVSR